MNKRQKEILQVQLDNEKAVLKELERNYQDSLDEINDKIAILRGRQDADMQHVIYQVEYQKALKTQVQSILEQLQTKEFDTLSEYLTHSYEDGYIGTMYDLQEQGIPLIFPIDQEQVLAAIQNETKLSEPLYTALGKDMKDLQKKITSEISRGLSSGQMYTEIARNISNWARIPKNNAMRIARTEAHRIQCKATSDAQFKAKEKGADVVKQWDASLDRKTRPHHRKLDGQIRELEEEFEVGGMTAMMPGGFGKASEDINCRCVLLQRARWALGDDVTKWTEKDGLVTIKAKDYQEFKKEYYKQIDAERVRSNAQKISEKRSTSEGIFSTYNSSKRDSIRPYNIMRDLRTSETGKELLEYLEAENVPIKLCYGMDNPKKYFGVYDPFEDEIIIYCDVTNTIKETAKTVIHEAMHRKLGSTGTFAEEVECFKAEVLHEKGILTQNDIDGIIKMVKEKYPHLE